MVVHGQAVQPPPFSLFPTAPSFGKKRREKARSTTTTGTYDVHPSVAYARSILDNLPEKTGRSAEQWLRLIKKSGPLGEKARREWLQKEHGLGGTTAWMLAERAEAKGGADPDTDPKAYLKAAEGYVESMYAGKKAGLRPIHDALVVRLS